MDCSRAAAPGRGQRIAGPASRQSARPGQTLPGRALPGSPLRRGAVPGGVVDHSNSMITSSTRRLSPAAAFTDFTTARRSARRMFSIFIASTVASA